MLSEKDKSGTGSKRLARACAFLDAASHISQQAQHAPKRKREMLEALADEMRDLAYLERQAYDRERPKPLGSYRDQMIDAGRGRQLGGRE